MAKLKFSNWRIFEFLKESNGDFSSARLFSFFVVGSAIIEWQKCIWNGIPWTPSWEEISLIAGVLGVKLIQKNLEEKTNKAKPTKEEKEEAEEIKI